MAVASLVLGIISLIVGFIPFCGAIALLPAIIALILGIVAIVQNKKKGQSVGMAVAGTVLSSIATLVILFWGFVLGALIVSTDFNEINNVLSNYENRTRVIYYNY